MTVPPRVAICQPSVILGGRLHVILHMIAVLNELGIVPDVLTARLAFVPDNLAARYKFSVRANFRRVWRLRVRGIPEDLRIAGFNWLLRSRGRPYDLLINTSNSLALLPPSLPVLSYVFYPRSARALSPAADIHRPEVATPRWSRARLERPALRLLYRTVRAWPNHRVVCMTRFTREAVRRHDGVTGDLSVIYPPVDLDDYASSATERRPAVVTVGRFTPAKRQLEQLRIAAALPELTFDVVGFVSDRGYFEECRRYAAQHRLANVRLHPDASFDRMVELLRTARYFLHTTINEPFGLTAVQATAAGCLPVVHDSGGQRETVPEAMLRYQRFDDIPVLVRRAEAMERQRLADLVHGLQAHARAEYGVEVFNARMRSLLQDALGGKRNHHASGTALIEG